MMRSPSIRPTVAVTTAAVLMVTVIFLGDWRRAGRESAPRPIGGV
jgi:hypothetical protein